MRHRLPATSLEVVKAPNFAYWLRMQLALTSAKLFGFWDHPRPNATEEAEEYTFVDEAYANYKYLRPLTQAEKNVREIVFKNNSSIVRLPGGFQKKASLTIGAAGDLMPAEGLEHSKDIMFEKISDVLLDVDISFANLEGPVTEQKVEVKFTGGETAPIMGFTVSEFDTLAGHKGKNFTALSFANNHTFDRGLEGLETTQRIFSQYGIADIGTPKSPEDYGRAKIFVVRGIKVGFIAATFSLNGLQLPKGETHRVHMTRLSSREVPADLGLLRKQIDDCKAQDCDFIVASIHWGYDFEFFPRQKQIDAAHTLVEEGVDLILGHHPHVIQPVEYYRTNRDTNRVAVIAYSLGGLGFRWYTAPHYALGLILNITLTKGAVDNAVRTYVESIAVIPVFQDILVSYNGDRKIKRLEKLQDQLNQDGTRHFARYLSKVKMYADLVLGPQNTRID
ncbi:CapA family protein [Mesorhizobium sp. M0115]|uniref:CapA family protein n=1 Tax=Mesorhizobium sp. M0115 TaxID=2956883 RepID=UPI0033390CDC